LSWVGALLIVVAIIVVYLIYRLRRKQRIEAELHREEQSPVEPRPGEASLTSEMQTDQQSSLSVIPQQPETPASPDQEHVQASCEIISTDNLPSPDSEQTRTNQEKPAIEPTSP
ncbi:MAG: hypothetical protein ACRDHW_21870, partial [Ktedonobacteraceae bacterium]